jgi:hypothetical protein
VHGKAQGLIEAGLNDGHKGVALYVERYVVRLHDEVEEDIQLRLIAGATLVDADHPIPAPEVMRLLRHGLVAAHAAAGLVSSQLPTTGHGHGHDSVLAPRNYPFLIDGQPPVPQSARAPAVPLLRRTERLRPLLWAVRYCRRILNPGPPLSSCCLLAGQDQ